ncbi:MAG: hypothetical protein FK733_04395 [Asgard group archaeon]|nr:hypothetical protein [Asgard group archaeon]
MTKERNEKIKSEKRTHGKSKAEGYAIGAILFVLLLMSIGAAIGLISWGISWLGSNEIGTSFGTAGLVLLLIGVVAIVFSIFLGYKLIQNVDWGPRSEHVRDIPSKEVMSGNETIEIRTDLTPEMEIEEIRNLIGELQNVSLHFIHKESRIKMGRIKEIVTSELNMEIKGHLVAKKE